MKKIFLSTLALSLLVVTATTAAFSQTNETVHFKPAHLPALPVSIADPEKSSGMVKVDAVNDKIQNAFDRSFTGATDAKWFALNDKKNVLAVYFDYNGRYSRAAYTKNGYMLYSVIQASEKLLPKENRSVIKSNFVDYDITNVAEVTSIGQTVWIVNLKNGEEIAILRVADGSYDEIARYTTLKSKK